jgi:hypothetical protein
MDRFEKPETDKLIQPQTAEELKKMAKSFTDLPEGFQISAEELEMVQEEVLGKPIQYGSPSQAVEAMQRRVAVLKQQKAELLNAIENCENKENANALMEQLNGLVQEIARSQTRLDAYEFQQKREN